MSIAAAPLALCRVLLSRFVLLFLLSFWTWRSRVTRIPSSVTTVSTVVPAPGRGMQGTPPPVSPVAPRPRPRCLAGVTCSPPSPAVVALSPSHGPASLVSLSIISMSTSGTALLASLTIWNTSAGPCRLCFFAKVASLLYAFAFTANFFSFSQDNPVHRESKKGILSATPPIIFQ